MGVLKNVLTLNLMWLECPVAVCCCFEKIPFWKENNAPDIWGKLKFTKLRDETIFRVFVTVLVYLFVYRCKDL